MWTSRSTLETEWEQKLPIVAVAVLALAIGIPPAIPPIGPTTSGDFTRGFEETDILDLMEITNTGVSGFGSATKGFLREAFIDTDGTIAPTFGECKGGMALSYKGICVMPPGGPLANTKEVLYLVNRPGNVVVMRAACLGSIGRSNWSPHMPGRSPCAGHRLHLNRRIGPLG